MTQGEVWEGGGGDNSGSTTGAGDTNSDDAVTEQTQKENSAATESGVRSDGGAVGAEEWGSRATGASGVLDVEAAEGLQRGRQRQGASREQRGVWDGPATQLVTRIAESDSGANAVRRG